MEAEQVSEAMQKSEQVEEEVASKSYKASTSKVNCSNSPVVVEVV